MNVADEADRKPDSPPPSSRRARPAGRVALLALVLLAGLTGFARAQALIAGDLDHDGDFDVNDAGVFSACLSGSGVAHSPSITCEESDIDHDADVDVTDFGLLQPCFTGPGNPGSLTCGGCVLPRADRMVAALANPIDPYRSTFVSIADSQVGAVYQLRRNADNTPVNSPVQGTGGTIQLPTGALPDTTAYNVLATSTAWGCSVQLAAAPTVTVNPYVPRNKIGVHVVGSLPDGPLPDVPMERSAFIGLLDACAAAGKPVAVVKCLDDYTQAADTKLHSPLTLTVGRKNDTASYDLQGFDRYADPASPAYTPPAQFAALIFAELKRYWDDNPSIDVWEICNEWSWWWAWQADFYIAMMDLCEATPPPAGHPPYRIALYGCSVGNPPQAFWPDIARACARAKAHGDHMLALHEYALWTDLLEQSHAQYGDALVLRYRRLYEYLKQHNADCPLILTEVGQGGGGEFVGTQLFVQDFGWYDTQLRADPYVVGCTAWLLSYQAWRGSDFSPALPELASYIAAH